MVARDREDRTGIIAQRFVELIVIIFGLAKIINNISEMIEESRLVRNAPGLEVCGHHIEHVDFIGIIARRRSSRVARAVKDDLTLLLDRRDHRGTLRAEGIRQRENFSIRHSGGVEGAGLGVEQRLNFGVRSVVGRVGLKEAFRIGQDLPALAKNGFGEQGRGWGCLGFDRLDP